VIIQRVNRTEAEKVFIIVENASGGTLSGNHPVAFTTTAASVDGLKVLAPASGQVQTFVGHMDADLGDTEYGLAQVWGYRDSVAIFATGTSGTVAVGIALGPGAGSDGVNSTGLLDSFGPVIGLEAIGAAICSPGGYAKGFIRAL